jgi:AraC-like DNA-binding protein
MEKIYDQNLLCVNEHISCNCYSHHIDVGFLYKEYPAGYEYASERTQSYAIFILLEGSLTIKESSLGNRLMQAGEMAFFNVHTALELHTKEKCRAIYCLMENISSLCSQFSLASLRTENLGPRQSLLRINDQIASFLDILSIYLRNNIYCSRLQLIKTEELLLCLHCFYSKGDLAQFFFPIIGQSLEFRQVICENINQVTSIQELIKLTHLRKTTFYQKFREEFGEENPKQWLSNCIGNRVLRACSLPNISVKELAFQLHFTSESALLKFCKRHFKKTPSQLIHMQCTAPNIANREASYKLGEGITLPLNAPFEQQTVIE